jgi:hypothetical protein
VIIEARASDLQVADRKEQIAACLRLILQVAMTDKGRPSTVNLKLGTLRDLLVAIYADSYVWSVDQRAHFEFVFRLINEWHTYFLSYTNDGGKIVNAKFNTVIGLFTDPETLKKRNPEIHNLLADAIIHGLQRLQLSRHGFYDKDAIQAADNLDEKIRPAASRTFAFAQLIQPETFASMRPMNWPYTEYDFFQTYTEVELKGHDTYRQVLTNRFVPVLTDEKDRLQLKVPPLEFEPWMKRIFARTHFVIIGNTVPAFEASIRELGDAIVNVAFAIIDNVPT